MEMMIVRISIAMTATEVMTIEPKALPYKTLRRGGPPAFLVNSYLLMTYSKKDFFKKNLLTGR
jgi:hypothetical protein